MPSYPGVNHLAAVRAFEKAGFAVVRQGKHLIMQKGQTILVLPRANPIKPHTMGALIKASGMTVAEFGRLLK